MKKDLSIKVIVPQPWRLIGRIVIVGCALVTCMAIWVTFFSNEVVEDIIVINTIAMIIFLIISFVFLIPVFIGRYPSWIVRIFGSEFLLRVISDCETLVSARRKNKATLANPYSWLSDHRVAWLLIFGALILLGIYNGYIYGQ
jgi:hypothetical protein